MVLATMDLMFAWVLSILKVDDFLPILAVTTVVLAPGIIAF